MPHLAQPQPWRLGGQSGPRTLQDYRDFGPVHGGGKTAVGNILFADGSVRGYTDSNGDGFLNPGFDPALYTGVGTIGHTDNTVELPGNEVYSGWTLTNSLKSRLDKQ